MKVVLLKHATNTGGVEKFIASFLAESRFDAQPLNVDVPMGFAGRWTYLRRLRRALPERVDVIVSCHIDTVETGLWLARRTGAFHVFREPAGAVHPFLTKTAARLLSRSLCIALSDAAIERWRNAGFQGPSAVVRPRILACLPMRTPDMNAPLSLVHVGNFFPEKDHPACIVLFEELKARWSAPVHLDLIGHPTATAYSAHVQNLAYRTEGVRLKSGVASAEDLLDSYSIGLLTSVSEGFGYVLLEYAGRGLPFFTTRTEGIAEVLPDDSPVFLPSNPAHWADHILHCVTSPEWRFALEAAQQALVASTSYTEAYDEAILRHCSK